MVRKYEKVCWSCGSKDLEHLEDHVRCRSCGATWNEVLKPYPPILIDVDSVTGEKNIGDAHRSGSPSKSSALRAAQRRGDLAKK